MSASLELDRIKFSPVWEKYDIPGVIANKIYLPTIQLLTAQAADCKSKQIILFTVETFVIIGIVANFLISSAMLPSGLDSINCIVTATIGGTISIGVILASYFNFKALKPIKSQIKKDTKEIEQIKGSKTVKCSDYIKYLTMEENQLVMYGLNTDDANVSMLLTYLVYNPNSEIKSKILKCVQGAKTNSAEYQNFKATFDRSFKLQGGQ